MAHAVGAAVLEPAAAWYQGIFLFLPTTERADVCPHASRTAVRGLENSVGKPLPAVTARKRSKPGTWVTLLSEDIGNTFRRRVLRSRSIIRRIVEPVGMWKSPGDFQGRWEGWKSWFWISRLSSGRHFHGLPIHSSPSRRRAARCSARSKVCSRVSRNPSRTGPYNTSK